MTRHALRTRSNHRTLNAAVRSTLPRRTNFLSAGTKFVPCLGEREAAERLRPVIADFSDGQLAQAASRSKETAKSWRNGRTFPNGASLINLARNLPGIRAWLYREIEQSEGFDSPQFLSALIGAVHKLATMPGPEGDAVRKAMRGES